MVRWGGVLWVAWHSPSGGRMLWTTEKSGADERGVQANLPGEGGDPSGRKVTNSVWVESGFDQ